MKRLNQWCLSNFSSAKFLLFPSTLGRSFGAVCACHFTPHSFIRAFISFFISVRILGFVFYLSVYAIYFAAQLVSDLASERFFVFLSAFPDMLGRCYLRCILYFPGQALPSATSRRDSGSSYCLRKILRSQNFDAKGVHARRRRPRPRSQALWADKIRDSVSIHASSTHHLPLSSPFR